MYSIQQIFFSFIFQNHYYKTEIHILTEKMNKIPSLCIEDGFCSRIYFGCRLLHLIFM